LLNGAESVLVHSISLAVGHLFETFMLQTFIALVSSFSWRN